MNITLKRWGNSAAIRLPQSLLSKLGDNIISFDVETSDSGLLLKPVEKKDITDLNDLFKGFNVESYLEENENNLEFDFGESQGKEGEIISYESSFSTRSSR